MFACTLLTQPPYETGPFVWAPECDLAEIEPLAETVEVFTFAGEREVIETGRPTT